MLYSILGMSIYYLHLLLTVYLRPISRCSLHSPLMMFWMPGSSWTTHAFLIYFLTFACCIWCLYVASVLSPDWYFINIASWTIAPLFICTLSFRVVHTFVLCDNPSAVFVLVQQLPKYGFPCAFPFFCSSCSPLISVKILQLSTPNILLAYWIATCKHFLCDIRKWK